MSVGQHGVEVVNEFVYLKSSVNASNNTAVEIIRRMVFGSRCLYGIRKLLRSKHKSQGSKIQIFFSQHFCMDLNHGSWRHTVYCGILYVFERSALMVNGEDNRALCCVFTDPEGDR